MILWTNKIFKFYFIIIMSTIPRFHKSELIIPRSARGYGSDEFLNFNWPSLFDSSQFKVFIEDLSGRWVTLGTLQKRVFIPNTYFPAHAMLVVVGKNKNGQQVRFIGTLKRGQLYNLNSVSEGDHSMDSYIPTQ